MFTMKEREGEKKRKMEEEGEFFKIKNNEAVHAIHIKHKSSCIKTRELIRA